MRRLFSLLLMMICTMPVWADSLDQLYKVAGWPDQRAHFTDAVSAAQQRYKNSLPPAVYQALVNNSNQRFQAQAMDRRAQAQLRANLPPLQAQRRTALFQLATLTGDTPAQFPPELADCASVPTLRHPIPVGDGAALLQRAGFALPVADAEEIDLRYRTPLGLVADLRAAGETNAILARDTRTPPRDLFPLAAARLAAAGGSIPATFRLLVLTGWAPSATQPQPARPGSATTRLAEALGTVERSAGEKTGR